MKTSLAVKISQTTHVSPHKSSTLRLTCGNTKWATGNQRAGEGGVSAVCSISSASLDCDLSMLERVPAGCDVVWIRVGTCWSEAAALRRWTRFVTGRGGLSICSRADEFRLLWVEIQQCFLIGTLTHIKGMGCKIQVFVLFLLE